MATINDVRLDRAVEFVPYIVEGIHGRPIDAAPIFLNAVEVSNLVASLTEMGTLHLIGATLQNLCERSDGTKLKTAFPSLHEFKNALHQTSATPHELIVALDEWASLGSNEILIHFEEKG